MGFEGAHLLLRHADHHHAIREWPPRPVVGDDVVFALTPLECDQRNLLRRGECLNRADKSIEHGAEQRWRRNRMAQMILEEVAQSARRLELRHVRMEVQAIETANGQGHMVANKLVDVGHRRLLWRGNRPMLLHTEYAGARRRRQRFHSQ